MIRHDREMSEATRASLSINAFLGSVDLQEFNVRNVRQLISLAYSLRNVEGEESVKVYE